MGVPVQRKELERDAVPTIQTKRPHGDETPVLGKRRSATTFPVRGFTQMNPNGT